MRGVVWVGRGGEIVALIRWWIFDRVASKMGPSGVGGPAVEERGPHPRVGATNDEEQPVPAGDREPLPAGQAEPPQVAELQQPRAPHRPQRL